MELIALKAKQAKEVLEFQESANEARANRMLLDLLSDENFGTDTFRETTTNDV
jgi:hypothetical protein